VPAKYKMNWESAVRRWTKTIRGRKYAVTCKQLSEWCGRRLSETKESTYQVANQWFEAKVLEAESGGIVTPEMIEAKRRLDWCLKHDQPEEAEHWANVLKWLPRRPDLWKQAKRGQAIRALVREGMPWDLVAEQEITDQLIDMASGEQVWRERLGDAPPAEHTLSYLLTEYDRLRESKVSMGELSPKTHETMRFLLVHLTDHLGETYDVRKLDERTWEGLVIHVRGLKLSPAYKGKIVGACKQFVQWLAGRRLVALPANFQSRELRIRKPGVDVKTLPIDVCRFLMTETPDHFRLFAMLALNCGFTQVDYSELTQDEVDWETGRIKRKRTKTDQVDAVPVVDYPLWPETFDLLRKLRSDDPQRVLLTRSGLPWVAGTGKSDRFYNAWDKLRKKLGAEIGTPKLLRKTSSDLLHHSQYGIHAQFWLGQAPNNVTAKHYKPANRETMADMVRWLHERYFGG
jgi:integrase